MKASHFVLLWLVVSSPTMAQNIDERIKLTANDLGNQVKEKKGKKVAVSALLYRECQTEFGKFIAEELTGYLSVLYPDLTVVNQKLLGKLLEQNNLSAKGILEAQNEAAKLGRVSGIDALIHGTITSLNDEVRISLSIVELPTLRVLGFSRTSFPLTRGITDKLDCETSIPTPDGDRPSPSTCQGTNSEGILFVLKECRMSSDKMLTCKMEITNQRKDGQDAEFRYNSRYARIITNTLNEYTAYSIKIGDSSNSSMIGNYTSYNSVFNTKVSAEVNFEIGKSSVNSLQIFELKDQSLRCSSVPVGGS